MCDEPTQEEACNHEIDTRMGQAKFEAIKEPFAVSDLADEIELYYGRCYPMVEVKKWFEQYCEANLCGESITPYDFVAELGLNDR